MPVTPIQPSFAAGELAPSLHGRVDLAKYQTGLKSARNVFVHAEGGVSNRPGTTFVAEVVDSARRARLIPFAFSTQQTYALEFGHETMRVIREGGLVVYPDGHADEGEIFALATPYQEADLPGLGFTQSADVQYHAHKGHAPRTLSRTDHHAWSLNAMNFAPAIATPTGLSGSPTSAGSTVCQYVVTAEKQETFEESLPTDPVTVNSADLSSTNKVNLSWSAVSGAARYSVYKEKNGLYGWIGATEATSFTDDNIKPELDDTPPKARNPFEGGNNPGCVCLFEQRITFAGSTPKPDTLWMSQSASYQNMTVSSPTKDDDAITRTIAAQQVNEIRHLVPLTSLIALTSGGEWAISGGGNGDPVTPANMVVKPHSYHGAADVPPIVSGASVLFVQEKGSRVRDLYFQLEADGFAGNDLSILAKHLFRGRRIVEWAYQKEPESIVWAVRDDGALLSLTYQREHQVWAWCRHDTDGHFESVCAVSEGAEDAVYFVVRRKIGGAWKRFIERQHGRGFEDVRDAFFVDCGLSWDDPKTVTGATNADPVVITAPGHGLADGDLVDLAGLTGMTELNDRRFVAREATSDTFTLETESGSAVDGTGYAPYAEGGTARKAVDSVTGLDHLEGRAVAILADGNVHIPRIVTDGAITLERAASRIHVGLPYESEIQTLSLELPGPTGSVQGRRKAVSKLILRVEKSRGLWAGPDAARLVEQKSTLSTYGAPLDLVTGDVEQAVRPDWNSQGSVLIRQKDPLPMTILAIVPEIEIGG
jgi:hypothetical protein